MLDTRRIHPISDFVPNPEGDIAPSEIERRQAAMQGLVEETERLHR